MNEMAFLRGYQTLTEYKAKHGNCLVKKVYCTENGYKLGIWVCNIRAGRYKLSEEQIKRLNDLGFVWSAQKNYEEIFNKGYCELKKYKERYGDCRVAESYKTEQGYKLGIWVKSIRNRKCRLSQENIDKLEEIGFVWNIKNNYEIRIKKLCEELERYKAKYGNCLVPIKYETEEGYKLGHWISLIRRGYYKLSDNEIDKLDEIGFVWRVTKSHEESFKRGYEELINYKRKHGNCLVPAKYEVEDGYKFGNWVQSVRGGIFKLNDEQRQKLEEAGFVWKARN